MQERPAGGGAVTGRFPRDLARGAEVAAEVGGFSSPRLAAWVPPESMCVTLVPAGRWWDAVRVPRDLAVPGLAVLGPDSGAVIEDGRCALWLLAGRARFR